MNSWKKIIYWGWLNKYINYYSYIVNTYYILLYCSFVLIKQMAK